MKKGVLIAVFALVFLVLNIDKSDAACADYCVSSTEIMLCFASESGTGCTTWDGTCCCIRETCPGGGICSASKCITPCTSDLDCGTDRCIYSTSKNDCSYRISHAKCDLNTKLCAPWNEYCPTSWGCDPADTTPECYDMCAGVSCPGYCSGKWSFSNGQCGGSCAKCSYTGQYCAAYGCIMVGGTSRCRLCTEQNPIPAEKCDGIDNDCDGKIDEGADGIKGSLCCAGKCGNWCDTYRSKDILKYAGVCTWQSTSPFYKCTYSSMDCNDQDYNSPNYCKNNKVYRTSYDYYCDENYNQCQLTTTEQLVQNCPYICYNAVCKLCVPDSTKLCPNQNGVCSGSKKTCVNGDLWTTCDYDAYAPGLYQLTETVCDGMDNDCDGTTDEGCPCVVGTTRQCGTTDIGPCEYGTQTCLAGGIWSGCIGNIEPIPELCNNQDDDCNGIVDDNVPPLNCPLQQGVCTGVQQSCANGAWQTCYYGPDFQSVETKCDNLDNDCNGVVDGFTDDCGTDIGVCKKGTQTCTSGTWSACGGAYVGPTLEICDNLDNDCNGLVDEYVTNTCMDFSTCGTYDTCDTCPSPPAEICGDGIDNNCNGKVDEGCGCGGISQRNCGYDANNDGVIDSRDNIGACRVGVEYCINDAWGPCLSSIGPSAELCNNQDDDCDGAIDDNIAPKNCPLQQGVCAGVQQICANGGWQPCDYGSNYATIETKCDGLDNDCNGAVDGITRGCGTDEGICQKGTQTCTAGAWGACGGNYIGPMQEVCDGLDNNCDGQVDENLMITCKDYANGCTPYQTCNPACPAPPAETCADSIDNNCNGEIDEGCSNDCTTPGATTPCGTKSCTGVRICQNNLKLSPCSSIGAECGVCCVCDSGASESYDETQDNDCSPTTCPGDSGCGVCGTYVWGDYPSSTSNYCAALKQCTTNQCEATCEDDSDGDGYSVSCGDCDDTDAAINSGASELCDGKDNNCNNEVDEDLVRNCGTATGECKQGTQACVNGAWGTCTGSTGPVAEICDGKDNDCNGETDEGCSCTNGAKQDCGLNAGECKAGIQLCSNGKWSTCVGAIEPKEEICDGMDNDCDNETDENLPTCIFMCGNDVCDSHEDCSICPVDCGQCTGTEPGEEGTVPKKPSVFLITMRNAVLEARILSVTNVEATVKNNGNKVLNNVKIKLEVPRGWIVTEPVTLEKMEPQEIADVSFKIGIPFLKEQKSVTMLNITSSQAFAQQILPVRIEIPPLLVAPAPSFNNYLFDDWVKIYTVINNKGQTTQMSDLEVEFNLNRNRNTLAADFHGQYYVEPDTIFFATTKLPLDYLGGKKYTIYAALYHKGKRIRESMAPLDLR